MTVRFSGLGGQGVVVSGVIFGHAAMFEGFDVLQSQSYGSTTRGGVTTSDVTLEHGPIHELECPEVNVLVALCQEALDRFLPLLAPGGLLVTESSLVEVESASVEPYRHISLPAFDTARKQLGRQILANIVTLGALSTVVEEVSPRSLERAILAHVPPGTEALNRQAFELGRELVEPRAMP